MHSLKVERLLDFGVWGKVQMEQDQKWDDGRKEKIYQVRQRFQMSILATW